MLPEGHAALLKALPDAMYDARTRLPAMLMDSLDEQLRRVQQLQADIGLIEHGSDWSLARPAPMDGSGSWASASAAMLTSERC